MYYGYIMKENILLAGSYKDAIFFELLREGFISDGINSTSYYDAKLKRMDKKITNRYRNHIYESILIYDKIGIAPSDLPYNYDYCGMAALKNIRFESATNDCLHGNQHYYVPYIDYDYYEYIKPFLQVALLKVLRNYHSCRDIQDLILGELKITQKGFSTYILKFLFEENAGKYIGDLVDTILQKLKYSDLRDIYGDFLFRLLKQVISISWHIRYYLDYSAETESGILGNDYIGGCVLRNSRIRSAAYKILKVEHHKLIGYLPKFNSIRETVEYKEKYKRSVKTFGSVLTELEWTLAIDGREQTIRKAEKDLTLALKSLKSVEKNKVSKFITLISVPIGIAELLLNSSFIGLTISSLGLLNEIRNEQVKKKNYWLMLIR